MLEPRRIAARARGGFRRPRARRRRRRRGRLPGALRAARRRRDAALVRHRGRLRAPARSRIPFLEDVGVVVLDEFHERHLQGDVALAVVRELQETRPTRSQARRDVGHARRPSRSPRSSAARRSSRSEGRALPVAIEHVRRARRRGGSRSRWRRGRARARRAATATCSSSCPAPARSAAPPRRSRRSRPRATSTSCRSTASCRSTSRTRALRAGPRRRSSSRPTSPRPRSRSRASPPSSTRASRASRASTRGTASTRCASCPISRASAEQRAGRAGRTGPGRCVRLWSRAEHAGRRAHETPEILRLDLTRTVLELRAWGLGDAVRGSAGSTRRPTPRSSAPSACCAASARSTTPARSPTSAADCSRCRPSRGSARMLIEAERLGAGPTARSGRRSPASATSSAPAWVRRATAPPATRIWHCAPSCSRMPPATASPRTRAARLGVDPGAVRAVERARAQLARLVRTTDRPATADAAAALRARRLSRSRRAPPRARVVARRHGRRDGRRPRARERRARCGAVRRARRRRRRAGPRHACASRAPSTRVARAPGADGDRARLGRGARARGGAHPRALGRPDAVRVDPYRRRPRGGGRCSWRASAPPIPRGGGARRRRAALLARLAFLGRTLPDLGLPTDPATLLADAVVEAAAGCVSLAELRRADLPAIVRRRLDHAQRTALDRDAPARLHLPSGRDATIVYEADKPPASRRASRSCSASRRRRGSAAAAYRSSSSCWRRTSDRCRSRTISRASGGRRTRRCGSSSAAATGGTRGRRIR